MLIGLLGYAGAGKDTVASLLPGFERRAFADKLRELALKVNPIANPGMYDYDDERLAELVSRLGWDRAKRDHLEVRTLLQNLGQGAREVLGDTVWIDAVLPFPIRGMPPTGTYDALDVVVTDVRYRNEAERILALGGKLCVVVRPGVDPVNNHASEGYAQWIERFEHSVILNDGSIDDLKLQVLKLVE